MIDTKLRGLFIAVAFLITTTTNAELWDMRERSFGAAIAEEDKATDPGFNGTKLFVDGRYFFKSEQGEASERRKCCALPAKPEYFYGLIEAQLRFGFEGTGLEYVMLDFAPLAALYEPTVESPKNLRATADALKLGAVRFISDDPLEVDYYLELSFFRAGRNGIYQWNRASPAAISGGVQTDLIALRVDVFDHFNEIIPLFLVRFAGNHRCPMTCITADIVFVHP